MPYAGLPIIIALGVLGNALAAIVMLRPRFRQLSASVYLLLLAFADTGCLLLNHKVQYWMMKDTGVSLFSVPWLCRIYLWLTLSVPFVSSWLVVLVTMERVIIVCRPLRAKTLCTRKHAWIASISMLGCVFLSNIYVFFIGWSGHCGLDPTYTRTITIVAIIMFSCLPFLLIVLSNTTICVELFRQHRFVVSKLAECATTHGDTHRLTFMLIANSCVFIVLTLPFNVVLAYKQVGGEPAFWVTVTSEYLVCLSHAGNFLLYTATGSLYRQELVTIFGGRWTKRPVYRGVGQRDNCIIKGGVGPGGSDGSPGVTYV